ncbi:MAG: type II toxin-antitoxin system VapB family antitoxin [Candidatus Acidiferrales bacterium]
MTLTIKYQWTERLAQQVAKETGESVTQAIEVALRERLQRLKPRFQGPIAGQELDDMIRRVDSLPTQDTRPDAEILGYD